MKAFKKRLLYLCIAVACILIPGIVYCNSVKKKIPDKLYIHVQDNAVVSIGVPVVGSVYESVSDKYIDDAYFNDKVTIYSGSTGKYHVNYKLFGIIPIARTDVEVVNEKYVYTGGFQVGIYLKCDGIYVVNTETICTEDGQNIAPAKGLIKKGDYIIEADNEKVETKEQLSRIISECDGQPVSLAIRRDGNISYTDVTPVKNVAGEYKAGIWIKDDTQGVGTVTYVCDDGGFAALGHGISDNETGKVLEITGGNIYKTKILSIVPGKNGEPGELLGTIDYKQENIIGDIDKNTDKGIYGENAYSFYEEFSPDLMPVGGAYEVRKGKAYIRFYTNGNYNDYEIEINDIRYAESKNITFKVTSPELLKLTNGIVQGMSGSPIIQNGKIVGAVTHVFVDDSTCGYGIFIDKMLEENN